MKKERNYLYSYVLWIKEEFINFLLIFYQTCEKELGGAKLKSSLQLMIESLCYTGDFNQGPGSLKSKAYTLKVFYKDAFAGLT